jgi:hypothetical protein
VFDAFASAEKTLHANPGGHNDLPAFETDSSLRFFRPAPHLTPPPAVSGCHSPARKAVTRCQVRSADGA